MPRILTAPRPAARARATAPRSPVRVYLRHSSCNAVCSAAPASASTPSEPRAPSEHFEPGAQSEEIVKDDSDAKNGLAARATVPLSPTLADPEGVLPTRVSPLRPAR